MSDKNKPSGMHGFMGGYAVKNMIEEVEHEMANGKHISAAPSSEYEAQRLKQVKEENRKSGMNVSQKDR